MILWTMQPVAVYEQLLRTGIYTCDKTKSENLCGGAIEDTLIEAYDWLVKQMDVRGIYHPKGLEYPVWAWHTHNWKRKQPDLRRSEYGRRGQEFVCLEIEIPEEQVLLSDFDAWHFVLNKWFLDDSKCEEEWKKNEEEFVALPLKEQEKRMEESWPKIFDITPIETDWYSNGRFVQAVFWELKKEQIRSIKFFRCR